jgi:hypothetical protein
MIGELQPSVKGPEFAESRDPGLRPDTGSGPGTTISAVGTRSRVSRSRIDQDWERGLVPARSLAPLCPAVNLELRPGYDRGDEQPVVTLRPD